MEQKQHIPILNTLRAIAALVVCLHHHLFTTKIYVHEYSPLRIFEWGNQGVTMFFVISGFVIPFSMYNKGFVLKKYGKFILKRLARLEPPYMAAIGLGILFAYVRMLNPNGNGIDITPTFKQVFLHLGYLIPFRSIFHYEFFRSKGWLIGVFWSLAVEFQYYFYIALVFPILLHRKNVFRFVGYCIIFATATLTFLRFDNNFLPSWLPIFMMGVLLFLLHIQRINKIEFYAMFVVTIAVGLYCRGYEVVLAGILSTALILLFKNFETRLLNFFSLISYSLYLLHTITGDPLLNFICPYTPDWIEEWLLLPIAFGFSTLCAYLFYLAVEKPSMRLSSSIKI